ncbi:ZZ-type zinc finger-containing protein 3-like isoform X3 [Penaeus chinensis]|uniref:ZZ-type zinc finger-containing protein 3-like isoform X3 n=1 Tax=Penaeus chinensis TaxID=139456 RepID=UPI001FB6BA83|nr:ZZ-type zinc finger-containing protein 3-like isoform X3 [Penaeus chinensis]
MFAEMSDVGDSRMEDLPSLSPAGDETGEYYFESDPLALKGNPDYQLLMKTLVRLQAQRSKAVRDMERLQEMREQALRDPLHFVTALQNGENLNLPGPQEIVQIPHIDWEKYNVQSIMQGMRPKTRKRILQESQQTHPDSKEPACSDKIMVRGRIYDESKPQTFNQSWTDEEQRKLEELLIKYPDETIASHRWVKISNELGTRTPLQVQSRVQKYFIALKRGGLPVPGRNPRTAVLRKQGARRRSVLHAVTPNRSSNFMKAFDMYEDEKDSIPSDVLNYVSQGYLDEVSDEEDLSEELRNSEEYQELLRLKQVQRYKQKELDTGVIVHPGFSCDVCGVDPIKGPRWHCVQCPATTSVDLCEKCVKTDFSTDSHQPSHVLQCFKALCVRDTVVSQN